MSQNKFYIVFRNTITNKTAKVFITPENNALSELWQRTFISNFLDNEDSKPLNKRFCVQAWIEEWESNDYERNLSTVCEELNHAIYKVNYYYGPFQYPHIDLNFNTENLKNIEWYRSAMNDLHHHFEVLIGQVENTSDWYFKPGYMEACYYVQQLNGLLHEIEAMVNKILLNQGDKRIMINYAGPRLDGTYRDEPERFKLTDREYESFSDLGSCWGELTIYYSQLGKRHYEVFIDGDEVIGDENISGYQYMIGESILQLGTNRSPDDPKYPAVSEDFREWLIENDFDPDDKKLALGTGLLGKLLVEDNLHLGQTWKEIDTVIHSMDDIYEMGFIDENENIIARSIYEYTSAEYTKIITEAYEKNPLRLRAEI